MLVSLPAVSSASRCLEETWLETSDAVFLDTFRTEQTFDDSQQLTLNGLECVCVGVCSLSAGVMPGTTDNHVRHSVNSTSPNSHFFRMCSSSKPSKPAAKLDGLLIAELLSSPFVFRAIFETLQSPTLFQKPNWSFVASTHEP